jgi:hypothetical protein
MYCRRSSVALAVCVLLAQVGPRSARAAAADEGTLEQIVMLNRNALASYKARKHDIARGLLLDAEMLAETNGLLQHEMTARTYLHLGIVHLHGLNQRDKGLRYFAQALQISPNIRPTPDVARGNVIRALREAKRRQKQLLAVPEVASVGKDKESGADEETAPADSDLSEDEEKPDELLDCPVADVAPPAQELEVHCRASAELRAERAFLFYRAAGQSDYTAVRMARDGKEGYAASVPAHALSGRALEFYVEAEEAEGRVTASNGGEARPRVVTLRRGAPAPVKLALADVRGSALLTGGAPPEDLVAARPGRGGRAAGGGIRRAPGDLFLGLGVGAGIGAHLTRTLEHHAGKKVSTGLANGGLMHVMPEVGLQYDDKLAISLQSRHQYIPPSGGPDSTVMGAPPKTAHALFARIYYEVSGGERMQLLGTATVGGGSGFRLKIAPAPVAGLPSSDTITGGPLVLGPGMAAFINLTDSMLLATEVRLLAGFDNFAAMGEASLGLQYAF